MRRLLCSLLGLAALVAAALPTGVFAQSQNPSLFQGVVPTPIAATALVVEMQNPPPQEYPHVGHRAPLTFEQAVNMWARAHFQLTGTGENTLRVTVRQGDITEKLLPVRKGIAGWFRKDQSAEYTATLDVLVALVDANGQHQGSAEAKTLHSTTVAEGTTEAEKQAVWMEMMKRLFANLDRELQPRIRQTLVRG